MQDALNGYMGSNMISGSFFARDNPTNAKPDANSPLPRSITVSSTVNPWHLCIDTANDRVSGIRVRVQYIPFEFHVTATGTIGKSWSLMHTPHFTSHALWFTFRKINNLYATDIVYHTGDVIQEILYTIQIHNSIALDRICDSCVFQNCIQNVYFAMKNRAIHSQSIDRVTVDRTYVTSIEQNIYKWSSYHRK